MTATARLVEAVRRGLAGAGVLDLRAVAEAYAQRCGAALERLERCGAEIERGDFMAALRGAESWPPLRDLIALLNMPERGAWDALCARRGLPTAPGFPAKRLEQLESLHAGAAALIPRLYRDYRGLAMQMRDAEALAVIRTISRIRPDDPDAQSEKARLEERAVAALTATMNAATAAGRTAEAAALSDELADFRPAAPPTPDPTPPSPPAAPVQPLTTSSASLSEDVREPFAVTSPPAKRVSPVPKRPAKAPTRRRWQTIAYTSAGIAAVGVLVWLAMKPAPTPGDDAAAAAESDGGLVQAIGNCRNATDLRRLSQETASAGMPTAEMLKAIRQRRAPTNLEDCLAQLRQLEREFGSSMDSAPAVHRMFQLIEQEALALCVRSGTRPPAFETTLDSDGKLAGYHWKDGSVAGTFLILSRFVDSGSLPDMAFPAPQTTPAWVAAEIAASKAVARPAEPPAAEPAAEPHREPEPTPAPDDASVARLSILPDWESLPALRPGPEWLESMAVILRHQKRILLTKSAIGFVGKERLAEDHVFSVQEGNIARRSRGDLLGIDLVGSGGSGVWRIYCASAAGFAEISASIANPFADHVLRWDPDRSAFLLSDATHAFLNRFQLLPGQSWRLECPFVVAPEVVRSLPITSSTVPFPLHSSQQQRSQASLMRDPVIKSLKAKMLAEKQKLNRSIRMQETSADKDPIVNSQRALRLKEYRDVFDRNMSTLQFEMEARIRALTEGPSTAQGIPLSLPGNGPFHVNLVSAEGSAPSVRLIELTPRP